MLTGAASPSLVARTPAGRHFTARLSAGAADGAGWRGPSYHRHRGPLRRLWSGPCMYALALAGARVTHPPTCSDPAQRQKCLLDSGHAQQQHPLLRPLGCYLRFPRGPCGVGVIVKLRLSWGGSRAQGPMANRWPGQELAQGMCWGLQDTQLIICGEDPRTQQQWPLRPWSVWRQDGVRHAEGKGGGWAGGSGIAPRVLSFGVTVIPPQMRRDTL